MAHFVIASVHLHVCDVAVVADFFDLCFGHDGVFAQFAVQANGATQYVFPSAIGAVLFLDRLVDG